jgi:hypothetical protein
MEGDERRPPSMSTVNRQPKSSGGTRRALAGLARAGGPGGLRGVICRALGRQPRTDRLGAPRGRELPRGRARGNGAGACSILNAPLRGVFHDRTCQQRWNARLSVLLRQRGARSRLRAELRAAPSARVVVHGEVASIELPEPLVAGPNRFLWTENCWMLEG